MHVDLKTVEDTLPEKWSDLLTLALADLKKCEASVKYHVNMWIWHEPQSGRCAVCAAGSVIAKTLHVPPSQSASPYKGFPQSVKTKLEGISDFSLGSYPTPSVELRTIVYHHVQPKVPYVVRASDKRGWNRYMRKLIQELAKAGY